MELWLWIVGAIILLFGFVVFRGAPYVPSHRRFVKTALTELYELSEKDTLVDLGSGDGIVLRVAAEQGARAVGYELNPALVLISQLLARGNENIETHLGDMWLVEIPDDTTVVYAFSVSRDMKKLERKVQQAANRLDRSLWLITYGLPIKGKKPTKELYAHRLYLFDPTKNPLQSGQA